MEQIFCHPGRLWWLPPIQLQQLCQEQGLIREGPPSLLTKNSRLTWKREDKTSPPLLLILIYLIPPQGHEHLVDDVVDTENEERCLHVIVQPDLSSTRVTCNSFLWYSTFSSTQHGSSCTPFFLSCARTKHEPRVIQQKTEQSLSQYIIYLKLSVL